MVKWESSKTGVRGPLTEPGAEAAPRVPASPEAEVRGLLEPCLGNTARLHFPKPVHPTPKGPVAAQSPTVASHQPRAKARTSPWSTVPKQIFLLHRSTTTHTSLHLSLQSQRTAQQK